MGVLLGWVQAPFLVPLLALLFSLERVSFQSTSDCVLGVGIPTGIPAQLREILCEALRVSVVYVAAPPGILTIRFPILTGS